MKTIPIFRYAAALALLLCGGVTPQSTAQQQGVAAANVTYKVLDISQIAATKGTPAQTLEAVLNDLAARGWRVVAVSGNLIILAAE